jgi:hypothetical protein
MRAIRVGNDDGSTVRAEVRLVHKLEYIRSRVWMKS